METSRLILQRYTLREMVSPFFVGFSVVTFLLVMDLLLDYLELILEKGVPAVTVAKLFVLGLGWMVALSIPCGVLVGTLMTFGRMSQDNEILAMRSAGVSLRTILTPPFAWGAFWTIVLMLFNNYVLPWSNHEFAQTLLDINRKQPTAELDEGVFIDAFDGHRLLFDALDSRTGEIRGVRILDFDRGQRLSTTTAKSGHLRYDKDRNQVVLTLRDGEISGVPEDASDSQSFRRTAFRTHEVVIGTDEKELTSRRRGRGQREMSGGELMAEIRTLKERQADARAEQSERLRQQGYAGFEEFEAFIVPEVRSIDRIVAFIRGTLPPPTPETDRRFVGPPDVRTVENFRMARLHIETLEKRENQFRVEYHKKFSIAFACIVFVFLGAPLGMLAKKGGVRAGFLSVVFFLFYYLCLVGGEQLADRRLLQPWLSMWIANIVLGMLGIFFTTRVAALRRRRRRRRPRAGGTLAHANP